MRSLGQNPTEAQLQDMIKGVDTDRNGSIDFHEFLTMIARLDSFGSFMPRHLFNYKHDMCIPRNMEGPEGPGLREEIKAAFNKFAKHEAGSIGAAELKAAMVNLGEELTDDEINKMIGECNGDSNDQINLESRYPSIPLHKTLG